MLKRFIVAATAAALGLVPMAQAQAQTAVATPIQLGQTVQGVVTETDALMAPNRRHDCYRLVVPKGQSFEVTASSPDFAAAIVLSQQDGCRYPGDGAVVDDDGAGARYSPGGQGWGLYLGVAGRRPGDLGAYRLEAKPVGERRTGEAVLTEMAELHSRIYVEENVPVRPFDQGSTRILPQHGTEWRIETPANARFSILAVCDENCDDLDMVVFDHLGREIASDREAADFARVGFGTGPGQATPVTIQLEMIECADAQGCLAGAIIYQVTD